MTPKQTLAISQFTLSKLLQYLNERVTEFVSIPSERKTDLAKVAAYDIRQRLSKLSQLSSHLSVHTIHGAAISRRSGHRLLPKYYD